MHCNDCFPVVLSGGIGNYQLLTRTLACVGHLPAPDAKKVTISIQILSFYHGQDTANSL